MDATVTFKLPLAVAQALDLNSCARYPSTPIEATGRWGLEVSRGRRDPQVNVTCKMQVAALVLTDVVAASKHLSAVRERPSYDMAVRAIHTAMQDAYTRQ